MVIFKKYYLLFLTLVVLVSYGQILGMYVWKDDNAVFFKFTHLNERAGYLGIGLLGSQPYKLTVTPYWFVYKIFGTDNTMPYYALALCFYILATFSVYKVLGKIPSLLFAAGYIASDGFMWLITSITQSLSIIFVLGVLYFYEKSYLLSLGSYFLASYFNPARTHYFIVVVVVFDLLYSIKKINLKEGLKSLLRLSPFLFIFYKYILQGDDRASGPFLVLKKILSGQIQYLHSFFATTSQLFIPFFTDSRWTVYLGVLIIVVLILAILIAKNKTQKDLILFSVWMLANTYAFTALEPYGDYSATVRYLAHSFVPLVGILALAFKKSRFLALLVVLWGLMNLYNSVSYQHAILNERSAPARKFYQDLKKDLPSIERGDIVYIDVADDAKVAYNAAFTVSQMPEETALAWRYGLDRYDFSLETEFTKLVNKIKDNNLSLDKIHTFYYSKNNLVNTTKIIRSNLEKSDELVSLPNLQTAFASQTPALLEMEIVATAQKTINDTKSTKNSISKNPDLRNLAFAYGKEIKRIRENSAVSVNSFWQDDIGVNINDNNIETAWRPNRVEWSTARGSLTLDLKKIININRFVWINAYSNSTPSRYSIEVSPDLQNWDKVAQGQNLKKLESGSLLVTEFDPIQARYVRMDIQESVNEDAPGIAEVWVVPSEFSKLPIQEAEDFLKNPFEFVPDIASFNDSLRWLNNRGLISVWWKNNKTNKWETSPLTRYPIIYDGKSHTYLFQVPAGGTIISEVKLDNSQIPGEIVIRSIKVRHPSIYE